MLAMAVTAQADNSGVTNASVESSAPRFIYPIGRGGSLPSAVSALEYTPSNQIDQSTHTVVNATTPSWLPTASSAGNVTLAGDRAVIDATSAANGVTVNVFITDLAALNEDYSPSVPPVEIYLSPCIAGACAWAAVSVAMTAALAYITSTSGVITFHVAGGMFYDVTIATGGSYYCTSTTADASAALSPTFYFTAQATPL